MPWSRVVTHREEGEIQYLVTVLVTQDEMDIYLDEMVAADYLPTGTVIDQGLLHLTVSMRPERCLLIEDHLWLTRISLDCHVNDWIVDELTICVNRFMSRRLCRRLIYLPSRSPLVIDYRVRELSFH